MKVRGWRIDQNPKNRPHTLVDSSGLGQFRDWRSPATGRAAPDSNGSRTSLFIQEGAGGENPRFHEPEGQEVEIPGHNHIDRSSDGRVQDGLVLRI